MKNVNAFEPKSEQNGPFEFGMKNPGIATMTLLRREAIHATTILTERELVILQCIANGKSSLEIAKELFISHHTVRTHRKNILQRTGAKNVAHLVHIAIYNGWI